MFPTLACCTETVVLFRNYRKLFSELFSFVISASLASTLWWHDRNPFEWYKSIRLRSNLYTLNFPFCSTVEKRKRIETNRCNKTSPMDFFSPIINNLTNVRIVVRNRFERKTSKLNSTRTDRKRRNGNLFFLTSGIVRRKVMKSGSLCSSFDMNILMKSSCSIASIETSVWQHTVAVRRCALIKATSWCLSSQSRKKTTTNKMKKKFDWDFYCYYCYCLSQKKNTHSKWTTLL